MVLFPSKILLYLLRYASNQHQRTIQFRSSLTKNQYQEKVILFLPLEKKRIVASFYKKEMGKVKVEKKSKGKLNNAIKASFHFLF